MPEVEVEFIGYDRDGDKVWRRNDNGRVFTASDEQNAIDWAFIDISGFHQSEYEGNWGPITKDGRND